MKAFIVAGGQGSRTSNPKLPKVLTQILGFPILDLQLMELIAINEVTSITLLLGHGADEVIRHLQEFLAIHITDKQIDFAIESEQLGSAGMLRQILFGAQDEICFVALGDILPRGGIKESFHTWRSAGSKKENIVITHPNNHPEDSDSVQTWPDTNLIKRIIPSREKFLQTKPNLSPVGFFFLRSSVVLFWPDKQKIDIVQDVLISLLLARRRIFVQDLLRRSLDIGTPERLLPTQELLANSSMILDWAVFIDRDETLIVDPMSPSSLGKSIAFKNGVIPLIRFLNGSGVPVVCISNQPSIAKGQSTFLKIEAQNAEIQNLLASESAYIDKWVYCPHHPEIGFEGEVTALKVSCECRKPKNGMIAEIESLHDIDISNSVILGDTFRDIEIETNLALRLHYLPHGTCDILTEHICIGNFKDAERILANHLRGSITDDSR